MVIPKKKWFHSEIKNTWFPVSVLPSSELISLQLSFKKKTKLWRQQEVNTVIWGKDKWPFPVWAGKNVLEPKWYNLPQHPAITPASYSLKVCMFFTAGCLGMPLGPSNCFWLQTFVYICVCFRHCYRVLLCVSYPLWHKHTLHVLRCFVSFWDVAFCGCVCVLRYWSCLQFSQPFWDLSVSGNEGMQGLTTFQGRCVCVDLF